jgi:NAD(P)H-hydrate epimerase
MPSLLLMENASAAVATAVREVLAGEGSISEVLFLCGKGNNGGDGYAAARRFLGAGIPVSVLALGAPDPARAPDAALNREIYVRAGGRVEPFPAPEIFADRLRSEPCLLVDALFGTGLARPLEGATRALVEAIGSASRPVVAVDLPTGLDADSGAILGAAIPAAVTVTFVAPKRGFTFGSGPSLVGRVVVADLGAPPWLVREIEAIGSRQ